MKDLECERRQVLRDFMVAATAATSESWSKLHELCQPACDSANAVDASRGTVDAEVSSLAVMGMEEKVGGVTVNDSERTPAPFFIFRPNLAARASCVCRCFLQQELTFPHIGRAAHTYGILPQYHMPACLGFDDFAFFFFFEKTCFSTRRQRAYIL